MMVLCVHCTLGYNDFNNNKRRISRWFRIRWKCFEKMNPKKVISKNVMEICTFFTFTHVCQTCFASNFFWFIFLRLFQRIRNQRDNLRFLISYLKKKNWGHIITFCKLWSQMGKNSSKNQKNVFCKCILDFNFAPIKGSVFFISKKSQIRCTLLYTLIIFGEREYKCKTYISMPTQYINYSWKLSERRFSSQSESA